MARLLADENFPRPVVIELVRLSHDVADIARLGLANRGYDDADVLALASADGRAVLTMDRGDFYRLHRARPGHAGIIACTQDVDWVRMAARIDAAIAAFSDLRGQFIRVVRPGPANR
jgi:hypothetical protein